MLPTTEIARRTDLALEEREAEIGLAPAVEEAIARAYRDGFVAAESHALELATALSGLLDVLSEYVGWRNTAAHEPRETIAENRARAILAKVRIDRP